jgi:hypothetical protein
MSSDAFEVKTFAKQICYSIDPRKILYTDVFRGAISTIWIENFKVLGEFTLSTKGRFMGRSTNGYLKFKESAIPADPDQDTNIWLIKNMMSDKHSKSYLTEEQQATSVNFSKIEGIFTLAFNNPITEPVILNYTQYVQKVLRESDKTWVDCFYL